MLVSSAIRWRRLATPAALSTRALFWYIPGGVLGVVFTVPVFERGAPDRLTWLAIAVLAQGAFSGLVLLTRLIPPRICYQPGAILVILAVSGAVRGLVIDRLASDLHPAGFGVPPVYQILTSALMSTVWMGCIGYLIQAYKDYRATFTTLFWQAVAVQRALVEEPVGRRSGVVDEVASARSAVLQELEAIDQSRDLGRQLHEAAEMLHDAVDQQIRPLSHELFAEKKVEPPPTRIGGLLFDAISSWDPPLRITVVLLVALIGIGSTRSAGLIIGVEVAAISAFSALVVLSIRARLISSYPSWRPWVSPLAVISLPIVAGLSLEVIGNQILGIRPDPYGAMVIAVAIPISVIFITALFGVRAERNLIIASLQLRIDIGQVYEVAAMQVNAELDAQLGTYLHHRVQSELTAIALQLKNASLQYDDASALQVINSARQRLSRTLSYDVDIELSDGRARLVQMVQDWAGIAVIELELPSGDFGTAAQWKTTALIADEAIGNSVRSGGAGQISMQVAVQETSLVLTVTDNGMGVSSSAKGGLGSAWLDINAPGRWSRESTPAGTTLTVEITDQPG
jgi:signal transduction histidine kinase